jgi:hypothetical protein
MGKKINRAFVLLDQASGDLRTEDETVIGLNLRPDVIAAFDKAKIDITIGVPGLSTANLTAPSDYTSFTDGYRVVALPAIAYGPVELSEFSSLRSNESPLAFISADRKLRGEAKQADLVPAPHAALLPMMATGDDIVAARVSGPRSRLERLFAKGGIVPMHFQPVTGGSSDWALIGLITQGALVAAVLNRLSVTPLNYDPMTDDLIWVRIDQSSEEVREALIPHKILYAEPGQVLIALKPGESTETINIHDSHGHSEVLIPDPGLMRSPTVKVDALFAETGPIIDDDDSIVESVESNPWQVRKWRWIRPHCSNVTSGYEDELARYSGLAPPGCTRHNNVTSYCTSRQ